MTKPPITDKYPDKVKGSTTTNDRKKQSYDGSLSATSMIEV